jgi:hypothetical protein
MAHVRITTSRRGEGPIKTMAYELGFHTENGLFYEEIQSFRAI